MDIIGDLAIGVVVVVNVSRGVIADAAERFPARVVEITASPEILAQRLGARGRETADDIARRLARDVPIPGKVSVHTIVNDSTPAEAADRFLTALRQYAPVFAV